MNFTRKRHPSADPKYIEQRIFAQWSVINSLAFAAWGWLIICSILFLLDDARTFLSIDGIIFVVCGLLIVADVFGIAIFLCNKAVGFYHIKKKGQLPPIKELKKVAYIINALWAPILFLAGQGAYNLFYEFMDGLTLNPLS